MTNKEQIKKLATRFRALGAEDPEGWARSQVVEGIPQYARFVFLWQAWKNVIAEGDNSWIDDWIEESERRPRGPGAGIGPALQRILASGASREDIAEIVRVMQWKVLSRIAYQIDDPGNEVFPGDVPPVNWKLFEVDDDGNPLRPIPGLHESVLDTEPSGREMRPRGVTRRA